MVHPLSIYVGRSVFQNSVALPPSGIRYALHEGGLTTRPKVRGPRWSMTRSPQRRRLALSDATIFIVLAGTKLTKQRSWRKFPVHRSRSDPSRSVWLDAGSEAAGWKHAMIAAPKPVVVSSRFLHTTGQPFSPLDERETARRCRIWPISR